MGDCCQSPQTTEYTPPYPIMQPKIQSNYGPYFPNQINDYPYPHNIPYRHQAFPYQQPRSPYQSITNVCPKTFYYSSTHQSHPGDMFYYFKYINIMLINKC